MVKVRIIKDYNSGKVGEIHNYNEKSAENIVSIGYAEYIEKKPYSNIVVNGLTGLPSVLNHLINQNQLNQLNHLTNLTIKEKIVLILYNYTYKINDIHKILKETTLQNISQTIKREDRGTGLFYEGLIEVKKVDGGVDVWGCTDKGIEYINNKYDNLLKQQEQKQRKQEEQEDFRQYTDNLEDYLNSIHVDESRKILRIDFKELLNIQPEICEKLEDDFNNQFMMCQQIVKANTGKNIHILFHNLTNNVYRDIGSLDYTYFNKLVMVEGIIKGRSDRRPQITSSKFECPNCGNIKIFIQKEKIFKHLTSCACKFKGKLTHLNDELITVQRLEIEEFSENLKGVTEPRSLNIILKNVVCDSSYQKDFNPGTRIKFWGSLKSDWNFKMMAKETLLNFYLEANGYEVLENSLEFNLKEEDKKIIESFVNKKGFFDLLAKSFCPEISDNIDIKKSLILSAVKGQVEKPKFKRDRIHVLLCSNPGRGKTILVKKLVELTPYSRFTSGLNSSKAGLTAAVVKDEFVGGWRLSAGAVPLANNGICVVDEMDKFQEDDKKSLNSVMEEGEVIVDKATIHQKLLSNTTIVGTCNPKNEKFDNENPTIEQLNLPRSLIDRFDLIFVLNSKEVGNPFMDIMLDDADDLVDDDFISKFILYARSMEVSISKEIKNFIAETAYNLKRGYSDFDFGFRQLHGLFRLSVAFAKVNLRVEVLKEDVLGASKLMISSLESMNIYYNGSNLI